MAVVGRHCSPDLYRGHPRQPRTSVRFSCLLPRCLRTPQAGVAGAAVEKAYAAPQGGRELGRSHTSGAPIAGAALNGPPVRSHPSHFTRASEPLQGCAGEVNGSEALAEDRCSLMQAVAPLKVESALDVLDKRNFLDAENTQGVVHAEIDLTAGRNLASKGSDIGHSGVAPVVCLGEMPQLSARPCDGRARGEVGPPPPALDQMPSSVLPAVREPSGWYSGIGALMGVTVRVELDIRHGVLDVHQYGITDWKILGVPWQVEEATQMAPLQGFCRQMVLGPELDAGLKGTVVESIDGVYDAEADAVNLVINLRITRWSPRIALRPVLTKVLRPEGAKFAKS